MTETVLGLEKFYWELTDDGGCYIIDICVSDIMFVDNYKNTIQTILEVYNKYSSVSLTNIKFLISLDNESLGERVNNVINYVVNYILFGEANPIEGCVIYWENPSVLDQLDKLQAESRITPPKPKNMTEWDYESYKRQQVKKHILCGSSFASLKRLV